MFRAIFPGLLALGLLLAACAPQAATELPAPATSTPSITPSPIPTETLVPSTPLPTRPPYDPGTQVEYTAQNGDNLIALAARFNTTIDEILIANPIIPQSATTLPAGLPMQIPIYYRAYWGSAYQIIPDSHFINGPSATEFDSQAFVDSQPGWLRNYRDYAGGKQRTGAGLVDLVATNFSVSPRLLLALLEYQSGALSQPSMNPDITYPLGYERRGYGSVYLQLVWAANQLNNGYYAWRNGKLTEFDLSNGTIFRPDPWQNAASVSLQLYFNEVLPSSQFDLAISPEGLAHTYASLFGDPWPNDVAHLEGSLTQPEFRLPFSSGEVWALTGGPHTGWGQGEPWAAMDFAPGEGEGCFGSKLWVTSIADGTVVRTDIGTVVLDLDGDGDERTGWVIFYLHVGKIDRAQVGDHLVAGQPVGHPSCEGGSSTGTHVHIARKYNGEWMEAAGAIPFVMEGWLPNEGGAPYVGTLTRLGYQVRACTCSDAASAITSASAAVPRPTPEFQTTEVTSSN
jgi:LasA protease